jgi:DNA-binding beta-propeller fold protein YncE
MGGIAVDPISHLVYVSDPVNDRIQVFDPNGVFQSSFGVSGLGNGQFQNPGGMAVDPSGTYLYVCDMGDNLIQKFSTSAGHAFVTQWNAGTVPAPPSPPTLGAPNPALTNLNSPTHVAADGSGNVYVSDDGWHRVIRTDASGGSPVLEWGGLDGQSGGTTSQMRNPYGITIDCDGNALVVDCYRDRVIKLP